MKTYSGTIITIGALCLAFVFGFLSAGKACAATTKYDRIFLETEIENQLPIHLLKNIAQVESSFDEDVITCKKKSPKGAEGIMQIIPKWHPSVNPCNPSEAIRYAGRYLSQLYDVLGSWKTAVAAYNWGIGNVFTGKMPPPSVIQYMNKVLYWGEPIVYDWPSLMRES